MKLINYRWVDDNNNSWRKEIYTEGQAEAYSKTLKDCSDCSDCSYCSYCSDCSGCQIQPEIYSTARIGSRNSNTIFFKNEGIVNVVCGCFSGTFAEWVARVQVTYPDKDNPYRKQYEIEIQKVKKLWGATCQPKS